MLFRTWFCPMPTMWAHMPRDKDDWWLGQSSRPTFLRKSPSVITHKHKTRQDLESINLCSGEYKSNHRPIMSNCEVAPRIWGHELKHCACSARNNCALSETIGATLKKMQPHLSTVHFADHCSVSLASLAGQWRRIWCSWNPETKTSTKASHIECFNWWK